MKKTKPRITLRRYTSPPPFVLIFKYKCVGPEGYTGVGRTPKEAYLNWEYWHEDTPSGKPNPLYFSGMF